MRTHPIQAPLRQLFAAIGLGLALSLGACGTKHQHHRSSVESRGTDWKAEGSVSTAPLQLTSPLVGDSFLSLSVQSERIEREYSFDMVRHESRQSRDPNVMAMAVGVTTLGLFCLVSDDCFGDSGEWRGGNARRENVQPTGRVRPLVEPYDGRVSADVLVQAFDAGGAMIDQLQSSVSGNGKLRVPVKTLAEQLPRRPAQLRVTTTLRSVQTEPTRQTLGAVELAPMRLYAEQWLPPAEQQALLIARLKPQLLAGDHRGALKNFAGLQALPITLPDSFLYLHAQSLLKTGARDQGYQYLQKYITASGESGTYATEARAQLALP